jgi:hypothetical protein
MVGETHELVCHVFKYDLGEVEHMPNLKNLASAQESKFSKLFMGAGAFVHVIKKGDAFLIYAFLAKNARPQQHEILLNTKVTRMCLKRKMLTLYQNINHMIAQLIWKKVHNPHLDPFIICHKTNL